MPSRGPLWARRYGTFPTEVSSVGFPDASFAPWVVALYSASRKAIGHLLEKCRALGGHGVIGVQLEGLDDPAGGLGFTRPSLPGAPSRAQPRALRRCRL